MKKNDEFELEITDLGSAGEGIGHHEGMVIFVRSALPGDIIRAAATKVKKKYAYARIVGFKEKSKDRVEPACPISDKCGGCPLMSLSYEKQLEYKAAKVREDLIRIGGFDAEYTDSVMEPIMGMDDPLRYRNKAQYPVGEDRDGNIITGFYAGHSHRIVPCGDCKIGDVGDGDILAVIRSWMADNSIPPYDEGSGKGLLRHVLIRRGQKNEGSPEIMVCLVINGDTLPERKSLISDLIRIDGMTSISININTRHDNVILGRETRIIWGSERITDESLGLAFEISPASFFQVNKRQTKRLYEKAIEYASLTGKETVWDLYCGIGTITLSMAPHAKNVLGVEIVPEAVIDAKKNAAANGITNAAFIEGAAEDVIPTCFEGRFEPDMDFAIERPDVIVIDPPRKGCDERLLTTILSARPDRIVYVSCDPATLARDLKLLCAGGYTLKRVCPTDMFAHGCHVEVICSLSKQMRKPDAHIDFELTAEVYEELAGDEHRTSYSVSNS